MTGFDVAHLFGGQLLRRTGLKVVLRPSPLKEPGPHVDVAVRKIVVPKGTKAASEQHELRLYVFMQGSVESNTGLEMAMDACETLATYLESITRLEDVDGNPIANTRVTSTVNEDDGILSDPEDEKIAWLDDLYSVNIWYPA
jgi:hypothetical protein